MATPIDCVDIKERGIAHFRFTRTVPNAIYTALFSAYIYYGTISVMVKALDQMT